MTVTGSFTGDLENGRIGNLSDIEVFRNGVAFRGSGALHTAQYDPRTRRWHEGGYLTLDGSANNVMFVDADYAHGDSGFFNYFYSVSGIGNAAFLPSHYRYRVAETTQLAVWAAPAAAPVPEPATWALLLLGFGALGGAMRRRRLAVPRSA